MRGRSPWRKAVGASECESGDRAALSDNTEITRVSHKPVKRSIHYGQPPRD